MSTYQKITIVGHLGDEPQIRNFDGGGMVANFPIATTERWTDKTTGEKKELTEWHKCVVNGKLAETIEKYVHKGDKVLIEGKLRTRKYTGTDNIERWITEVIVKEFTFMQSKQQTQESGSAVESYQSNKDSENNGPEQHDDLPF